MPEVTRRPAAIRRRLTGWVILAIAAGVITIFVGMCAVGSLPMILVGVAMTVVSVVWASSWTKRWRGLACTAYWIAVAVGVLMLIF